MLGPILGLVGVFIIVASYEILWRLGVVRGEFSRRMVHIWVGTYIAIWPFFMSWEAIQILAAAMLVVVSLSRRFHILKGIHSVNRRTYGEYFFPISVGLCSLITDSKWIFMASILHLSLADGLAGLIGTRFGKRTYYRIFGQNKSWIGTGTFLLLSVYIVFVAVAGDIGAFATVSPLVVIWLPLLATAAESVAVYGTDDLLVPLIVVTVMELLTTTSQFI